METKMAIIYEIVNTTNNRSYVGQTRRTLNERLNYHKNENRKSTPLYNAIRKYGWENFSFHIVEECEIDDINDREIYWIAEKKTLYPNGYNLTTGGNQCSHNQYTKDKISRQRTGMKFSDTHRENIRRSRLGTTIPEEQRKKMSESHKGFKHTEETKEKLKYLQPHRREVGRFDSNDNIIQKFDSISEAGKILNCSPGNISECCNGKRKMKKILKGDTLRFLT
jgi:group I intron endonuclease